MYTKGNWYTVEVEQAISICVAPEDTGESCLAEVYKDNANDPYYSACYHSEDAQANACLIAAAPIGAEIVSAILAQEGDGLDRWDWLVKKAKEFQAKAAIASAESQS